MSRIVCSAAVGTGVASGAHNAVATTSLHQAAKNHVVVGATYEQLNRAVDADLVVSLEQAAAFSALSGIAISAADVALNAHCEIALDQSPAVNIVAQLGWQGAALNINHTARTTVRMPGYHNISVTTPMLCVDRYSVRESDYALRQSYLMTDISADISLTESPYQPSSYIQIAPLNQSKKPAMPLFIAGIATVHKPHANDRLTTTPWDTKPAVDVTNGTPYLMEPPLLPGDPIPEPDVQESYVTMNIVNIFALPSNEPIAYRDLSISMGDGQIPWGCSFNVTNEASRALVAPDLDGFNEVRVEINGWEWVFYISTATESRSISGNKLNKNYAVRGISRTQYLASPAAPLRSKSIGSTTAVQAATDELDGTGFTLNWDTNKQPDWPMRDSAFSYQSLTALQVIKRLSEAAGAVVRADTAADELIVMPKYHPLPWQLQSHTVDHSIHEAQILSLETNYVDGELYNAVRVISGVDTSDSLDLTVERNGTAGDQPAADVVDDLLTAYDGNKARGEQILAASGTWIQYTIKLSVPESQGAEPGLLMPGQTVAVVFNDNAQSFRGYVRSTSITVQKNGRVTQTISVARPYEWESN